MPSLLKNPLVWFGIVVLLAGLGVGIAAAAGAFKKKTSPPPATRPVIHNYVPGEIPDVPGTVFLGSLSQSVSQASTVIVPIEVDSSTCPLGCKTMVEATWTYTDSTHKTGSYSVTNPTISNGTMTINYARSDGGLNNACIMTVKAWQETSTGVSGSPTSVWGFFT
jgi:hypothetical protein